MHSYKYKLNVLSYESRIGFGSHSNVFCGAFRNGQTEKMIPVVEKLASFKDLTLKNHLLLGMTCSKDTWILNKVLNDTAESHDVLTIIKSVASNPNGHLVAWNFLKNNWHSLHKKQEIIKLS